MFSVEDFLVACPPPQFGPDFSLFPRNTPYLTPLTASEGLFLTWFLPVPNLWKAKSIPSLPWPTLREFSKWLDLVLVFFFTVPKITLWSTPQHVTFSWDLGITSVPSGPCPLLAVTALCFSFVERFLLPFDVVLAGPSNKNRYGYGIPRIYLGQTWNCWKSSVFKSWPIPWGNAILV